MDQHFKGLQYQTKLNFVFWLWSAGFPMHDFQNLLKLDFFPPLIILVSQYLNKCSYTGKLSTFVGIRYQTRLSVADRESFSGKLRVTHRCLSSEYPWIRLNFRSRSTFLVSLRVKRLTSSRKTINFLLFFFLALTFWFKKFKETVFSEIFIPLRFLYTIVPQIPYVQKVTGIFVFRK